MTRSDYGFHTLHAGDTGIKLIIHLSDASTGWFDISGLTSVFGIAVFTCDHCGAQITVGDGYECSTDRTRHQVELPIELSHWCNCVRRDAGFYDCEYVTFHGGPDYHGVGATGTRRIEVKEALNGEDH